MVKHLVSAPDNKLLSTAEVTTESTLASVAKMLREKMFRGVFDVSDPRFLALASHLALLHQKIGGLQFAVSGGLRG